MSLIYDEGDCLRIEKGEEVLFFLKLLIAKLRISYLKAINGVERQLVKETCRQVFI